MFLIGLVLAITASALFVTVEDGNTWPIVIAIIGIGLIAASNYRLMKPKKQ